MKWSSNHPTYREVAERDRGVCQRCGSAGTAEHPNQVHHLRPADRRENTHVAERLKVVCWLCHGEIHAHPAISYEDGWLLHSWARFRCPDCEEWHGDEHGRRTGDEDPRCPACTDLIEALLEEIGAT